MISRKGRILFRADGDSQMGLGHIVRCGALAEMLGEDWECILYTCCEVPDVISEAKKKFSKLVQLPITKEYKKEAAGFSRDISANDIVVLDGYHFREDYQIRIRATGATVVCIDDMHSCFFNASAVINSAGGITPVEYKALPGTQFYLGPQYTLLRKPFLEQAAVRNKKEKNKNIFICLGGADPDNKILETVKLIASFKRFNKIKIVTGGGYSHTETLQQYIADHQLNAELFSSVTATEMAAVMSSCSYAVCSPSTVSYEYMTAGGVIYLKQIAENQDDMIRYLTKEGFAFLLEQAGTADESAEEKSLTRQAEVFDGRAAERIKQIFDKLAFARQVKIRRAKQEDMLRCYEWANDPLVREQSFNSAPIKLSDHEVWFASRLADTHSFFYILELEGLPFAQIRFQVKEAAAALGYLVDKDYRSKGLGIIILSKGIETFTTEFRNNILINGFVKFSNIASQRSFERLRFVKTEASEYEASYKYTMHYDGH